MSFGQDLGKQLIEATIKGANYREAGEIEKAKSTLDSAIIIASDNNQIFHKANLTYHLGLTYMVNKEYQDGKLILRQAFEQFKSLNGRQNHMAASSLMNASDVLREQGRMTEALNYIEESITFLSDNIRTRKDSTMLVNLYNRWSDIYRLTGDFSRAKNVIYEAPFWPGVDYSHYYTNLANAFKDEGAYLDSAEFYYQLNLQFELEAESQSNWALAIAQGNLSQLYVEQDRFEEALPLTLASLQNFKKANRADSLIPLIDLGRLELGRKRVDQAKVYLIRAEKGINSFTDEEILEAYFKAQRDLAAATGEQDTYEFYLGKSDSLSKKKFEEDRLLLFENERDRERQQEAQLRSAQEETLAQRRMINILQGVGLFILAILVYYFAVTSRKMRALSGRNELLVREQNHRVKNNLQMINSLLSLQAGRLKDEQSKDVLKKSQTRIQAISLLNRSLYEQKDISTVDLKNYVEELTQDVINSVTDETVEKHVQVAELKLDIDKATSLGLIINELIVNSIKHNAAQPGFDLEITTKASEVHLKYKDHNPGFDLSSYQNSRSFGKRLIELQSRQLKADLSIKDKSHFELNLVFNL